MDAAVPWLRISVDAVDVHVRVVPRASRSRIAGTIGDRLKVQIAAPPVDGEANREVAELLAKTAGLPARAAVVTTGAASRSKTIRLACEDPVAVAARLVAAAAQVR